MATGPTRPEVTVAPGRVLGASLLLPGLGHVLAGLVGSGVARGILAVLWLGGGLTILVGAPRAAAGWLLVSAAAVLWVATAIDARRLVAGYATPLLGTRVLLGLVLVVTGLLVMTALLATPGMG